MEDTRNIPEAKNRVFDGSIDALTDIKITPEMVASHIKVSKSDKAPGEDGLSSSFLKKVEGQIVKPLVIIFTKSLHDGSSMAWIRMIEGWQISLRFL